MKTLKILSVITSLASICFASQAISVLDVIQNPANGHNYYLLTPASWTDSEAFAQTLGGTLATVRSAAENTWISATFFPLTPPPSASENPGLWIGLYDPTQDMLGGSHASNFVWADGEQAPYRNWYFGQPDNTGGIEFYTQLRGTSNQDPLTWNDLPNDGGGAAGQVYGVVEVVPEPQSMALIAVGAGAFMAYRRKIS